ncbi:hypothetical protein [Alteriqipengyuania lutimaris]|uniref:Uncharacterized protein n=1 Tax=Alteriqipengyuania lutimaris TaxID=1538146 RepID=A0A395LGY9_9SPHN|nr:hypothetical protein [Alteriqipengyuania lutimaris]MBB3035501.1 hypothetical protein [Alteriqipengyuania lutimaris]RDS76063.1 hypothetical protein DL238_15510 [Alteriqipengyuania lutimaris]
MHSEALPAPAPSAARRGHAGRLEAALIALAGGHGHVFDHRERGWASITFAGARHTLRITFDTPQAIEGGEALIAELPDHEFALPGRLVADATVSAVDHVQAAADGSGPRLTVTCELLLLDDA